MSRELGTNALLPYFFGDDPVSGLLSGLEARLSEWAVQRVYLGSVAANAYGARTTDYDVEFCVARETLECVSSALKRDATKIVASGCGRA